MLQEASVPHVTLGAGKRCSFRRQAVIPARDSPASLTDLRTAGRGAFALEKQKDPATSVEASKSVSEDDKHPSPARVIQELQSG